jgi:hypothetical protein
MRFRLRTLLLLFVLVAIFLTASVRFVRWAGSRPGAEVMDYLGEVADIEKQLGDQTIQDLRIWRLYGWGTGNLWTAKVPREAIECLKRSMHLVPIAESRLPRGFWNVPPDLSESPHWWKPKPTAVAEYYMSPSFDPRGSTIDNDIDGAVMYDPVEKRVWVFSHFDF